MNTVMLFVLIGLSVALFIVNKVDKSNKKKVQENKQKIDNTTEKVDK